MTASSQALTADRVIAGMDERIRALELALKKLEESERWPMEFSLSGALYVSESPPFAAPYRLKFYQIHAEVVSLTAGSVTVAVRVDGVAVKTFTITQEGSVEIPFSEVVNRDGNITVAITSVGTASTIAVQLRR